MGNKRTAWLAWALCGLTTCLAIVLFGADLLSPNHSSNVFKLASDAFFVLVMPAVFGIVGALIVSRQPRNTIGWLLMAPVGLVLLEAPIERYIERIAPAAPTPTLPLLLMVWFSGWSWLLLIFPLIHIPLLFPNGQPPTPRWRWVSRAAIAWAALFILIATLSQPLHAATTPDLVFDNPIGVLREDSAGPLIGAWIAGLMMLVVLCVAALFVRYRRANATERKQIKWLLYACAVFAVIYVGGWNLGEGETFADNVYNVLFSVSVLLFPVAIGIAILRHRLYDIDIIIRRTLVYSILMLTLGLVYVGCIVVLQQLVVPVVGGSDVAIVASTLAIAALFTPLRRRIQNLIDRRFYRRKYDAANVLAAFGATARDETDLERLTSEMLRVVDETVQPEFVGLWLRESRRGDVIG
jgi:hypothetical protein